MPITPDAEARNAHVAALCKRLENAAIGQDLDLIVLPELSSMEYSDLAFTRLNALAEPGDGPTFQCFSALAQKLGTAIVFGFARQSERGTTICQAAIAPSGDLLGHYDKLHLAQFGASAEAGAFNAGDHLFCFSVKGLKIAPLICYDIRFPDLAARLAGEGVDVVMQCSAYARDLSFHSWRHFVVSRAMENGMAWLGLNRAGPDWGGSIWCPGYADGDDPEVVFGADEEFRRISLPLDFRRHVAERLPFLKDRRDDYNTLPVQVPPGEIGT